MKGLWFLVPAHGRVALTEVCLRQLARTCQTLTENGLQASAVVVADDENLETAKALGFGTVKRQNTPLGRKWNDAFHLAGLAGVDYFVPMGSDDWIDANLLLTGELPGPAEIRCCHQSTVVSEDRTRLARLRFPPTYEGGDGIRIYPRGLLEPLGFRPADEDRPRAIDTNILMRVTQSLGRRPRLVYHDLHALQIVDFKSETQLNSYDACLFDARFGIDESTDVWAELAEFYPAVAIGEMQALQERKLVAA